MSAVRSSAVRVRAGRSKAPRRPALSLLPPVAPSRAGTGMFALVVAGILVAGMLVLLLLNTWLAQGAFELSALTSRQGDLQQQQQQLMQTVSQAESPTALSARAAQMGMVPSQAPVFLRLSDGAVLGSPAKASGARPASHVAPLALPRLAATTSRSTARTVTPVTTAAATDAAVADPAPAGDAAAPDPTGGR